MRSIGLAELLVILALAPIVLVPAIFYLRTLQRALAQCSQESRTMDPGSVWLLLIPLFNIVWQFLVVVNISKSLRNEFVRRNLAAAEMEPGKAIGLAMCILEVCGIIPILRIVASVAAVVCWIIYWVKISGYSKKLLKGNIEFGATAGGAGLHG